MSKVDIKFNNQIMNKENIKKLAESVNDVYDGNLSTTDLKVKTIEQSNHNWSSDNLTIESTWLNGLTASNAYVKFVVINNIMYLVVSATLKNTTGSSITTATSKALINAITIPEEYADKIYRKDGTKVSASYSIDDVIIGGTLRASANSGANKALIEGNVYSSVANKLGIWIATGTITVPANSSYILDFRTFIVL